MVFAAAFLALIAGTATADDSKLAKDGLRADKRGAAFVDKS